MTLPRREKSRVLGQKRQEQQVDVRVLAPCLDLLEDAFGCEGFRVGSGRLSLGCR